MLSGETTSQPTADSTQSSSHSEQPKQSRISSHSTCIDSTGTNPLAQTNTPEDMLWQQLESIYSWVGL